MKNLFSVNNYFSAHVELVRQLDSSAFADGIRMVQDAFSSGNKILTCGNGGSALTASHYITDWNKMITISTGQKFRGICLADNIGLVSAYANDLSYDEFGKMHP